VPFPYSPRASPANDFCFINLFAIHKFRFLSAWIHGATAPGNRAAKLTKLTAPGGGERSSGGERGGPRCSREIKKRNRPFLCGDFFTYAQAPVNF